MPTIAFEDGSRAVPVDFRRCRSTELWRRLASRAWSTAPTADLRGHRLRPRRRLPAGCRRALRSGGRRLLGRPGRQPLPPVLDLLRRLRDPARRPDRRRAGLSPRRLGEGADPHRPRRRGRRASLFPQRLQLLAGVSPTGARTRGSARSRSFAEAVGARAPQRLGPGDAPAARLRWQPRRQRRSAAPRRPLHARPSRPPDPARADRRQTSARASFAIRPPGASRSGRPRGRRDRLSARTPL